MKVFFCFLQMFLQHFKVSADVFLHYLVTLACLSRFSVHVSDGQFGFVLYKTTLVL